MLKFNTKTITVINRLKASDSLTKQDVYHKTVLNDCAWYTSMDSAVIGQNISMGSKYKVLIPFSDKFLPYIEWKQEGKQDEFYTMSETDVIILGIVDEEITPQNINSIKKKFEPNVCEVRSVIVNEDRNVPGIIYQLSCNGV